MDKAGRGLPPTRALPRSSYVPDGWDAQRGSHPNVRPAGSDWA